MINAMRRVADRLRGDGEYAATVPPMDGALRPNHLLDKASVVFAMDRPDNLIADGNRILFSSGGSVLAFDPTLGPDGNSPRAEVITEFNSLVTCLASDGKGRIAAGLDDGRVVLLAENSGDENLKLGENMPGCPTAMAFVEPGLLYVCQGSAEHKPSQWKMDLMGRGSSGSVWRLEIGSQQANCLARNLAFPFGLMPVEQGGALLISESWRHRLLQLETKPGAAPVTVLTDLPGYPSRLCAAADGGFWLCVFAPRSQLIEFILRERHFCERMMREVDPAFWCAPALWSGRSYLEPLQYGGVKQMGIMKPWAPTRSYGMLVRLTPAAQPIASAHSRADGVRHGITSCVELADRVLIACQGGNAILQLASDSLRGI